MPTSKLPSPKTAPELLDMYFLEARCHLLETAACLDRIERAPGGDEIQQDPRIQQLLEALDILKTSGAGRAVAFLERFSDKD